MSGFYGSWENMKLILEVFRGPNWAKICYLVQLLIFIWL